VLIASLIVITDTPSFKPLIHDNNVDRNYIVVASGGRS
jgi:hypothetical protein